MPLIERVKKIREDQGKTQKEMASLVDVGLRTWQQYEEGIHDPSWKVVCKLIDLGYSADWLSDGVGNMKREQVEYPSADTLGGADASREPESFVIDTDPETAKTIRERMDRTLTLYGVTLSNQKNIAMFVTLCRVFDKKFCPNQAMREVSLDYIIDNLVRLTLPEENKGG